MLWHFSNERKEVNLSAEGFSRFTSSFILVLACCRVHLTCKWQRWHWRGLKVYQLKGSFELFRVTQVIFPIGIDHRPLTIDHWPLINKIEIIVKKWHKFIVQVTVSSWRKIVKCKCRADCTLIDDGINYIHLIL